MEEEEEVRRRRRFPTTNLQYRYFPNGVPHGHRSLFGQQIQNGVAVFGFGH